MFNNLKNSRVMHAQMSGNECEIMQGTGLPRTIFSMHTLQVTVLGSENLEIKVFISLLSPSPLPRHHHQILAYSFHLTHLDIVTGIKVAFLLLTCMTAKRSVKASDSGTYFWNPKVLGICTQPDPSNKGLTSFLACSSLSGASRYVIIMKKQRGKKESYLQKISIHAT